MPIKLNKDDSVAINRIHRLALEGDFLPSLGEKFLETLYRGTLEKPGIYGFGVKEKGKVVGFVVGTKGINLFFKEAFKSSLPKLVYYLILRLLTHPRLIKNVLETALYSSKDKGPKAELIVIAVTPAHQGKGYGKELTKSLERAFLEDGIKEYKLTVHRDKKAVGFYEHLGYKRISTFKLYGKIWYVYSKKAIRQENAQASPRRKSLL